MTRRRTLVDLCCCEGGASTGYALAGFDVVGIDTEAQPNDPFRFVNADAVEVLERLAASVSSGARGHRAVGFVGDRTGRHPGLSDGRFGETRQVRRGGEARRARVRRRPVANRDRVGFRVAE